MRARLNVASITSRHAGLAGWLEDLGKTAPPGTVPRLLVGRRPARYRGRGGVSFAIVGAGGAGITAEDSVLESSTGQVLGSVGKMSDPPATIAKRFVYPFLAPREQRRSG